MVISSSPNIGWRRGPHFHGGAIIGPSRSWPLVPYWDSNPTQNKAKNHTNIWVEHLLELKCRGCSPTHRNGSRRRQIPRWELPSWFLLPCARGFLVALLATLHTTSTLPWSPIGCVDEESRCGSISPPLGFFGVRQPRPQTTGSWGYMVRESAMVRYLAHGLSTTESVNSRSCRHASAHRAERTGNDRIVAWRVGPGCQWRKVQCGGWRGGPGCRHSAPPWLGFVGRGWVGRSWFRPNTRFFLFFCFSFSSHFFLNQIFKYSN
jgi:hypothetical protein